MLVIKTLTQENMYWQGSEIPSLRTQKANALLFFLIIEWSYYRRTTHRREFLADLLWPEQERSAALNNLRQSLHIIKLTFKQKGVPPIFRASKQTVSKAEGLSIWCDLQALHSNSSIGLLRLPNGPLCPCANLILFDAYPFQEWLEVLHAHIDQQAEQEIRKAIESEIATQNWIFAERLLLSYLSRNEGTPFIFEKLALSYAKQGKSVEAEHWFNQAGVNAQTRKEKIQSLQKLEPNTPNEKAYSPKPKALELYLRAWSIYNQATPESTNEAVAFFQETIAIDPGFQRAYLGLATAITTQGSWWGDKKMYELVPALELAIQAVVANPTLLPEIDSIMGFAKMWLWEIAEAEYLFRRSTKATSSTSYGWMGLAHIVNMQGRHEEARELAQRAINKDPLYIQSFICLAEAELLLGNYGQAEEICKIALAKKNDYHPGLSILMWALIKLQRYEEAILIAQQSIHRSGSRSYYVIGRLAVAYHLNGAVDKAQELFQEMKARASSGEKGLPYFIALYLQNIGQTEQALNWLEQYIVDIPTDYLWLKVQPEFKSLHKESRFEQLLRTVGLN